MTTIMTPPQSLTMMNNNNMMTIWDNIHDDVNNNGGVINIDDHNNKSCCEETASTSTRSSSSSTSNTSLSLSLRSINESNGGSYYEYSSSSYCSSSSAVVNKVKFSTQVFVVETLHIADYTSEEVYDSFYDCYEIKSFKDDAKKIARTNQQPSSTKTKPLSNDDDVDFRGTERFTRCPSTLKRMEIQKLSIEKVLNEQTLWGDLEDSDDMISSAYKTVTKDAIKMAHEIGLYDQKQAVEEEEEACEAVQEQEREGEEQGNNDVTTSISSTSSSSLLLKVFSPSFQQKQTQTKEQGKKKTTTTTTTKAPSSFQLPSSSGLFRLAGSKGKGNARKINVGTWKGKWL